MSRQIFRRPHQNKMIRGTPPNHNNLVDDALDQHGPVLHHLMNKFKRRGKQNIVRAPPRQPKGESTGILGQLNQPNNLINNSQPLPPIINGGGFHLDTGRQPRQPRQPARPQNKLQPEPRKSGIDFDTGFNPRPRQPQPRKKLNINNLSREQKMRLKKILKQKRQSKL